MKRRLAFFHVGPHKTGTNSVQWFLKENRRTFLRHDMLVPVTGMGTRGAHHGLVRALCEPAVDRHDMVAAFASELADSPASAIVVSSEGLEGRLLVGRCAKAFFANLAELNLEARIILFPRNQPQWLNSRYTQQIKSFRTTESFDELACRTMNASFCRYSSWINMCRTFGVELLTRPYTTAVAARGIIPEFVAALDLDRSAFGALDTRRNVSAGPFTVSVARASLIRISGGQKLTHFQAVRCKTLFSRYLKDRQLSDAGYCGLTSELAREIEQKCQPDNDKFSLSMWGRTWQAAFAGDVGRSFEPNDPMLIDTPEAMRDRLRTATEEVCELLARVMSDPSLQVDPGLSLSEDDRNDRTFWE